MFQFVIVLWRFRPNLSFRPPTLFRVKKCTLGLYLIEDCPHNIRIFETVNEPKAHNRYKAWIQYLVTHIFWLPSTNPLKFLGLPPIVIGELWVIDKKQVLEPMLGSWADNKKINLCVISVIYFFCCNLILLYTYSEWYPDSIVCIWTGARGTGQ